MLLHLLAGRCVRKMNSPDSRQTKKSNIPEQVPILTSTAVPVDSNSKCLEQPLEAKKVLTHKDLGPGYLQYLGPTELALYRAYRIASPEDRQFMIERGEVESEEVEKAFILEHIFDHLPVPGKDFTPVEPAEGNEIYLEPGLRELFLLEKQKKLSIHYLDHQRFTFETRTKVVDMMAGKLVSSSWRRDTFLLAVNILDTVLSRGELRPNELIIYSLACIKIAVKLNERYFMSFEDLVASVSEVITKEKMDRAEMNILTFLDFDVLGIPSHQFLIRINQLDKFNKPLLTMAKYLLEVSLLDLPLVAELPSKVAAACYALARRIMVDSSWSPSRHYYSGYSLEELEPLIDTLIDTVHRLPTTSRIFPHYYHEKRYFVSDRVHSVLCPDYKIGQFKVESLL
ncbi:G2/mitotic-specific cyclin-B3 [Massospora cicadina]|nr:G2/mitotic-specific cyclin-B3 [Massospora cicadina]